MGPNPPLGRFVLFAGLLLVLTMSACAGSDESTTASVDPALAQDVRAEASARSAQTAMETYAVDRGGSYAGADLDALIRIEPTLKGDPLKITSTRSTYGIAAQSESGTFFAVARKAHGDLQFKCNVPGTGDCPKGGHWEH